MDNLPAIYNFDTHYRGDAFKSLDFRFSTSGVPINLVGCVATMQIRVSGQNKRAKVIYEFSSEATDLEKKLLLTDDGIITFPLIKEFIIPANQYIYDLEIKDVNDVARTFMAGTFNVEQDITVVEL
jgi:hypothetical protein